LGDPATLWKTLLQANFPPLQKGGEIFPLETLLGAIKYFALKKLTEP
jgi:hypothetical protein